MQATTRLIEGQVAGSDTTPAVTAVCTAGDNQEEVPIAPWWKRRWPGRCWVSQCGINAAGVRAHEEGRDGRGYCRPSLLRTTPQCASQPSLPCLHSGGPITHGCFAHQIAASPSNRAVNGGRCRAGFWWWDRASDRKGGRGQCGGTREATAQPMAKQRPLSDDTPPLSCPTPHTGY